MKKTLVILSREYCMRLRRPAFWVLTLLVPLLLAALYAIPVIAAKDASDRVTVLVVDETGLFGTLQSTDEVFFQPQPDLVHARQCMAQPLALYLPCAAGSESDSRVLLFSVLLIVLLLGARFRTSAGLGTGLWYGSNSG